MSLPLISVCIPTYHRPKDLLEAIQSCLSQTYTRIEIIICDDSKNDATEQAVADLVLSGRIRYYRNRPSLGQAGNVNRLFTLATGQYICLLHDDDLLLPNALQEMLACWDQYPDLTVCFGKQHIMNSAGKILEAESETLNQTYFRTAQTQGLQKYSLQSALLNFPNDAYLITADAARTVGYRNTPDVGSACDFDFGLRLASAYKYFYFLNRYTAVYRISDESVLQSSNYTNLTYRLVEQLVVPPEVEPTRRAILQRYSSAALNQFLLLGDKQSARSVYTSSWYPWRLRLSSRGLAQAILLLLPLPLTKRLIAKLQKRK